MEWGGAFFLCTMSFLSWVEGSGEINWKSYRETRSKLFMHQDRRCMTI